MKSQAITEDGQVWFWGGFYYDENAPSVKLQIDGFNLLNEEPGIPPGAKIL